MHARKSVVSRIEPVFEKLCEQIDQEWQAPFLTTREHTTKACVYVSWGGQSWLTYTSLGTVYDDMPISYLKGSVEQQRRHINLTKTS